MTEIQKSPRIIVVDDDASIANLNSMLLESNGYEVRSFNDSREVIEEAKKWRPDLIVSDMEMPYFSGPGMLTELDKNDQTKDIPAILVTAAHDSKNPELLECIACQRASLLAKPFDIDDLAQAVADKLASIKQKEVQKPQHSPFQLPSNPTGLCFQVFYQPVLRVA